MKGGKMEGEEMWRKMRGNEGVGRKRQVGGIFKVSQRIKGNNFAI